jgi:hypothetical protein
MAVMQVIEFGPPHRAGALGQRRAETCRASKRTVRRDLPAWGSFRPGPGFSGGVLRLPGAGDAGLALLGTWAADLGVRQTRGGGTASLDDGTGTSGPGQRRP